MKKIYETPLNGWDESAERLHIYAIESREEWWELEEMKFGDLCRYFDVCEPGCEVIPGSIYHTYNFEVTEKHIIMTEIVAYDV